MTVVSRLAPSPTGAQHLGNARTYLIAWLSARRQGGRVILRIEDIDSPRIKPGAAEQILDDFRWLGLDWDDGPYLQTPRLPLYEEALERLRRQDLVYPCTCSRTDVLRAASAPHVEHEGPRYPGTCAGRHAADAVDLTSYSWRMRTDLRPWSWHDLYHGSQEVSLADRGGDFVVWKSAGTPAYQLAVVVDDAAMGINEVIRGDDLLSSTPRQLLLYEALDLPAPQFGHVPLVVGPDGRRLAKRHGDTRLATLREAGMTAHELLGLLAWSCGWLARPQPIGVDELLGRFRWDTIPREPFVLESSYLQRWL